MAIYNANTGIAEMYVGNVKIVEAYLGDELIFGNTQTVVTYNVDDGESYSETYNQGDSVLSPQTFTPTKTGYTFLGWREDDTASSNVLVTETASGATMSLYAVFQKTVTVTYYTGTYSTATAQTTTGTQYYNNTNTLDPTFNLTCDPITNWTVRGWTTASSGGASTIDYQDATDFTTDSDITIYSCYTREVTVTYNANGGSGTTAASNGIAYHHSGSGSTNAAIVLRSSSFTRTNYSFASWRLNSASGTAYAAGATYASTADATMYEEWYSTAKVTFNYNGGVQTYTAPVAGTYKLEVYGAQGGVPLSVTGGKGGYSYGNVSLTKGQKLKVVVGGQGANSWAYGGGTTSAAGGYNGGGIGYTWAEEGWQKIYCAGGGGATHIAKNDGSYGLLSSYANTSTAAKYVYIVAGGGGGNAIYDSTSNTHAGGTGGGSSGGNGSGNGAGTGGTQSAGAAFGKGGNGSEGNYAGSASGGGGGWYGGKGGKTQDATNAAGGGGSGYIGNVTGTKATSAGQRSGSGIAYITPPS